MTKQELIREIEAFETEQTKKEITSLENTAVKIVGIKFEDILKAYTGKPDRCMCGCSGKYTHTEINRALASKGRGYEVDDDEVNDKRVRTILKKILNQPTGKIENDNNKIFSTVIGKTQYTLYLKGA
jgi:hypothetical protein